MNNPFLISIIGATVGSGIMCGLFFTFSNFVMKALYRLPPNYGTAAMQSVNATILNPWFLALFLGTAVLSVALGVYALLQWSQSGAGWILAGSIFYLAGCMLVTMCFNVPLNDKLAAVDPEHPDSVTTWREYVRRWMPWNHVRTLSTLASTASFVVGLIHLR